MKYIFRLINLTLAFVLTMFISVSAVQAKPAKSMVEIVDCGVFKITSSKDISNIVYRVDGVDTKLDELSGRMYILEESNVTDIWVKSGNNHSGDGPGYGEHFAVDDSELCEPVIGMCETTADCETGQSCLLPINLCSASIGGRVFADNDADGTLTTGDAGINPAIALLDKDVNGIWENVTAETTDTSGNYRFSDLVPNIDYRVRVENIPGETPFVFTLQDVGTDDSIDSDVDAQGISHLIATAPNEDNATIWAGVLANNTGMCDLDQDCPNTLFCGEGGLCVATLAGRAFIDNDADGVFSIGDTVPPTLLMRLQVPVGGIWTNTAADTTDENGLYSFNFLTPVFDYRIKVEPLPEDPALVFTAKDVGLDDTIDSDFDADGFSDPIVVEPDQVLDNYDAGILDASPVP